MIGGGVAQRIEESAAAARVAPALGMHALDVVAHVQKIGPGLIVEVRGPGRPRDVRLAAVGEFDLGPLAAIGAGDEQHGEAAVRHGGGRGLVDEVAVAETLDA